MAEDQSNGDASQRLARRSNPRLPSQAHKVGSSVSVSEEGGSKKFVVVDARLLKEQRAWEYKVENESRETRWVKDDKISP